MTALAIVFLLSTPFLVAMATPTGGFLWLGVGAAVWGGSVVVKFTLAWLIHGYSKRLKPLSSATLHGVLSAACELGAAAAFLVWVLPEGTAWNAASFGAGAGGIEVLFLLVLAIREKPEPAKTEEYPWHVRWTFVVERTGALIGHTGSRGLVWLGIHRVGWLALVAVLAFSLVDGVATYGSTMRWDWLEWQTWKRFYGSVTVISVLELMLFVLSVA